MILRNPVMSFLVSMSIMLTGHVDRAGAEGRCPPGSYPVGGQGVGGCAPMAAGGGAASSQPRATGRWHKTWGAISTSTTGMVGLSVGRMSRADALGEAQGYCASKGATDCQGFAYKNQCVALADPPARSGYPSGVSTGATEEVARAEAIKRCEGKGAPSCTAVYSACTKPVFEFY